MFNQKKKLPTQKLISVENIHSEIFSVHEILVKEAEKIAGELLEDSEKEKIVRQLNEIGFTRAANIGEQVDALDRRKGIKWYEQNNPTQKFIDEETVLKICEKYNLYLTHVQYFTGKIPEKNQKEILDFRIKETALLNGNRVEWVNYSFDLIKVSYEYKKEIDVKWEARAQKIKELDKSMNLVGCCDLKIIASESELDMRFLQKRGRELVHDPVVLQPVKWGYLIVTAWGKEASDENILNEKMN